MTHNALMEQAGFLLPITGNRHRVTSALHVRSNYNALLIFLSGTTKLDAQFLLSEDTCKRNKCIPLYLQAGCWLIVTIWSLFPAILSCKAATTSAEHY